MYYFAPFEQTSTAKFAAFFHIFFKTVRALRVNSFKVTLRKNFIDNVFSLESKNQSKNDKKILRFVDLAVNT